MRDFMEKGYNASNSLEKLRKAILRFLEKENVKVVLFGSRARKDFGSASDVDIGIIPKEGFDQRKITLLREAVENLNIPYKVEIVDLFHGVSDRFREGVLKEAVVWKE